MPRLPKTLFLGQQRTSFLFERSAFRYPHQGRRRAIRTDRRRRLLAVLDVLLSFSCLSLEGLLCRVVDGEARPITVSEVAKAAAIPDIAAKRCLSQLTEMGLLKTEKQRRYYDRQGVLCVSGVFRRLTSKFWSALGLLEQFIADCKYCQRTQHIRLITKRYKIGLKLRRLKSVCAEAMHRGKSYLGKEKSREELAQDRARLFKLYGLPSLC